MDFEQTVRATFRVIAAIAFVLVVISGVVVTAFMLLASAMAPYMYEFNRLLIAGYFLCLAFVSAAVHTGIALGIRWSAKRWLDR